MQNESFHKSHAKGTADTSLQDGGVKKAPQSTSDMESLFFSNATQRGNSKGCKQKMECIGLNFDDKGRLVLI